jgi:predicted nucleic acid-binding protein
MYNNNGKMMRIVSDTSVVIAVIAGEPDRDRLIELTQGVDLLAPSSLHWEIGNALSSQLRRGRLTLQEAEGFLRAYQRIPIQFVEVSLSAALEIAEEQGVYAYDAYMIACAQKYRIPLLTLDQTMARAGKAAGVEVLEVN